MRARKCHSLQECEAAHTTDLLLARRARLSGTDEPDVLKDLVTAPGVLVQRCRNWPCSRGRSALSASNHRSRQVLAVHIAYEEDAGDMQDHEDEHQVCKHLVDLFPEFPGPLRAALVTLAVRGHLRPGCGQTVPLLGAIAGGLSDVPGAVWAPGGRPRVAFAFTFAGGRIAAIDLVADPDRLRQVELAEASGD